MAAITGRLQGFKAHVQVSIDAGTTYNSIPHTVTVKLDVSGKSIDATDHDSAGWEEAMPGFAKWKASLEWNYSAMDTVQDSIFTARTANTLLYFKFQPITNVGNEQYTGTGYVLNMTNVNANNTDLQKVSCEIDGTGPLAIATQ